MAILIVADNDVGGAVLALRRIIESAAWAVLSAPLVLEFKTFADIGLGHNAPDLVVWTTCQQLGAVLITGNRAGGADSLDEAIRQISSPASLPVVTIGDADRLVREPSYAEAAALGLIDLLERIETLRGSGRLYIP